MSEKTYVVYSSGDGTYESEVAIGIEAAKRALAKHMWFGPYEEACEDEMVGSYIKELSDKENWCMGKWEWDGEQCSGFIAEITNPPSPTASSVASEEK